MLSAFHAQPVIELKQRDKSKIEALLSYGDRILVGLSTGALRVYRLNESSSTGAATSGDVNKPVDLLSEVDKFSKKPVQSLAIVKEANLLVSLSDAYVSLHDLQSHQLVERLERTKGATCFAVTSNVVKDAATGVPGLVSHLAVGTKRKLLCWTWQDMELVSHVNEWNPEATVKTLVWADGAHLVVGMDAGFSVIDLISGSTTPISKPASRTVGGAEAGSGELAGVRFGAVSSSGMGYMGMASWVPRPMVTPCARDEILLARDVNSLFVNVDGQPLEKRQVPWAVAPEAIGYSYPFLLALNPPEKGTLQIRNPDSLSLLQTVSVPGAAYLHVPQPNISLAHAGKGFLVASDRVIWRMNALPYKRQFGDLLSKQRYDEAISLLDILEDTLIDDKSGRMREYKTLKAISLFQQRKYQTSLDMFIEAQTSPDRVIALYPREISGELSSAAHATGDDRSPQAQSDLVADEPSDHSPATPAKGVLQKLRGGARKTESDAALTKTGANDQSDETAREKPGQSAEVHLTGEDLKTAARCLNSFLAETRRRIQNHLTSDGALKHNPPHFESDTGRPEFFNLLPASVDMQDTEAVDWQAELVTTAKLVDTTLFRSYMLATPSLAGSLFRIDNFCDPVVVQSALYESKRYNDLIEFLHGKKLHREALEILAKFGAGHVDVDVPEDMQGTQSTVGYLKQLPPELADLVLEFVRWPIEVDPQKGMEVFLADSDNAENLPRRQVLDFLTTVDQRLVIQYLEHVVRELGDGDPDFHQRLVDLYIEQLRQYDASEDIRLDVKGRLESLLSSSRHYNKNRTFKELPTNDPVFYESRAVVLSAMGNHKQALSIYVFQLQDYEKAETYCNRTYNEDQAKQRACLLDDAKGHERISHRPRQNEAYEKPNIFAVLLSLYLRPPDGEDKRWPQALELLSKHGARLPASSTLDLMPDDLAIKELQDYFCGRVRNATSILREAALVKALESVSRASADQQLSLSERSKRVRVTEENRCCICQKRFGASAVKVLPDTGTVIHYGCSSRSGKPTNVRTTSLR